MAPCKSHAQRQKEYRERMKAKPDYVIKERQRHREKRAKAKENESERSVRHRRRYEKLKKQKQRALKKAFVSPEAPQSNTDTGSSWQKVKGRSIRRKHLENLHEELRLAKESRGKWKRKADTLRKQVERLKTASTKVSLIHDRNNNESPVKIVEKLMANPKATKRILLHHHALLSAIKVYPHKTSLAKQLSHGIIKKYRLKRFHAHSCAIDIKTSSRLLQRKERSDSKPPLTIKAITDFYDRDDNSRLTTGRKDTRTKNQIKKQRRILMDSVSNLYEKFLIDYPEQQISYAYFAKCRPFYVLPPQIRDRETCLCKLHDNCQLLCDRLFQLKVIPTKNLEVLMQYLVCSMQNKKCVWQECMECKNKQLVEPDFNNVPITVHQWQTVDSGTGHLQTKKEPTVKSLLEVVKLFHKLMWKLVKHTFVLRHQYRKLRESKEAKSESKIDVHIDFSENYLCKYTKEIQAAHFGTSHEQVSLHTGILYNNFTTEPFCSISNSTRHDASAIWAHLKPVLKYIQTNYHLVQHINFWSDGPASQYKNRRNLYLLSKEIFLHGFKSCSWNYFEAGHGKGAPDGVGAALKRFADGLVAKGVDIPTPLAFYKQLHGNVNVRLFFIDKTEVRQNSMIMLIYL
jgi:hypothetical protein